MSHNINLKLPNGFECKELKVLLTPRKKIPVSCTLKSEPILEPIQVLETPKLIDPPKPEPNMPPIADVEINRPWDVYDHRDDKSKMPYSIDYKGYRYEITHEIVIPEGFAGAGTKQHLRIPEGFAI